MKPHSDCPPVIFLVFNRPEHTRRVFERIREARPTRLFVVADGPRESHSEDGPKCAQVRAIVDEVDWDCDVIRDYSDDNQGSGVRVCSGITEGLNLFAKAVILEDDCLPNPTFFQFCKEMLERHEGDSNVMQISGNSPLRTRGPSSYLYAYSGNNWGWATWQRAWKKIDFDLSTLDDPVSRENLKHSCPSSVEYEFWMHHLTRTKSQTWPPTWWDLQWYYTRLVSGGLSVIPRVNLVENIGFGTDATHTKSSLRQPIRSCRMTWPLAHPARVQRDIDYDRRAFAEQHGLTMPDLSWGQWLRFGLRNRLRRLLSIMGNTD